MHGPQQVVEHELVGLELAVLGQMLQHWAQPRDVDKRKSEWLLKLPAFRVATDTGTSCDTAEGRERGGRSGSRDLYGRDIVIDEFNEMLRVFRVLRDNPDILESVEIGCHEMKRPLPIPISHIPKVRAWLRNKRIKDKNAAATLVGWRLVLSTETVLSHVAKGPRIRKSPAGASGRLRPEQGLIASLLLDLTSFSASPKDLVPVFAHGLDALLASQYPSIKAYYLVQAMHAIRRFADNPIAVAKPTKGLIRALCRKLTRSRSGPCQTYALAGTLAL